MLVPTEDINLIKNHTLELLRSVNRLGMEDLIAWMQKEGFFVKPASIKHHMNINSGLLIHSYRLYQTFKQTNDRTQLVPEESVIICAFLHDLCKVPLYELDENDKWDYTPGRKYEERHGTISIELAEKFITLTDDEFYIIKYHMGLFYSDLVKNESEYSAIELHRAIDTCAAVQIFAACDMEVSRWKPYGDYWSSDTWKSIGSIKKVTAPTVASPIVAASPLPITSPIGEQNSASMQKAPVKFKLGGKL